MHHKARSKGSNNRNGGGSNHHDHHNRHNNNRRNNNNNNKIDNNSNNSYNDGAPHRGRSRQGTTPPRQPGNPTNNRHGNRSKNRAACTVCGSTHHHWNQCQATDEEIESYYSYNSTGQYGICMHCGKGGSHLPSNCFKHPNAQSSANGDFGRRSEYCNFCKKNTNHKLGDCPEERKWTTRTDWLIQTAAEHLPYCIVCGSTYHRLSACNSPQVAQRIIDFQNQGKAVLVEWLRAPHDAEFSPRDVSFCGYCAIFCDHNTMTCPVSAVEYRREPRAFHAKRFVIKSNDGHEVAPLVKSPTATAHEKDDRASSGGDSATKQTANGALHDNFFPFFAHYTITWDANGQPFFEGDSIRSDHARRHPDEYIHEGWWSFNDIGNFQPFFPPVSTRFTSKDCEARDEPNNVINHARAGLIPFCSNCGQFGVVKDDDGDFVMTQSGLGMEGNFAGAGKCSIVFENPMHRVGGLYASLEGRYLPHGRCWCTRSDPSILWTPARRPVPA